MAREAADGQQPDRGPRVRVRAWIEWDGETFIGPGRAALLEEIDRHGSITRAAREVGVSYRTAWAWIRRMNRLASGRLVEASPGGRGGGGAALTPGGRAVLEAHRRLTRETAAFVDRMNRQIGDPREPGTRDQDSSTPIPSETHRRGSSRVKT
ncbi:LysR family transcriptional regulator [Myxococcota bacterium]|jgi:molybdate transport system regulatory protein|nr:LysR family transcriptional regulator [Myxococcota bacterium]